MVNEDFHLPNVLVFMVCDLLTITLAPSHFVPEAGYGIMIHRYRLASMVWHSQLQWDGSKTTA